MQIPARLPPFQSLPSPPTAPRGKPTAEQIPVRETPSRALSGIDATLLPRGRPDAGQVADYAARQALRQYGDIAHSNETATAM